MEQGGVASDRVYRLVNNEQLETAQQSRLGVDLGLAMGDNGELDRLVLSAVGQADDIGLLANSLKNLKLLLQLTVMYCEKYQVKLVGSKTKLLVFNTKETVLQSMVEQAITTISVDGEDILPSSQASHVGFVRSVLGNEANIVARLSSHRGAVYGLLSAGMAKGHRANPAASLRVETVFGIPVLLSGLASLVLSAKEENLIAQHYKVHVQRLLRLHQATPAPVVFLLAGCLPLPAQLHIKMFTLFGQLCRLRSGDNVLTARARIIFSAASPTTRSWFWMIRQLSLQYGLPHPLDWLDSRPSKQVVKSKVRAADLEVIVNDCMELSAVQFWLDCSTMSPVITAVQQVGESILFGILKMTRNYCHGLYRARAALLESDSD